MVASVTISYYYERQQKEQIVNLKSICRFLEHVKYRIELFAMPIKRIYEEYKDKGITKVVGSEAKGFIVGSILASRLHVGFVMARKAGILPYDTIGEDYVKNGTERRLEIHTDTLNENDVVLLHDDVLGTGATMNAIHRLVKRLGVKQTYISFVVELGALHGRENLPEGVDVKTLLRLN